MLAERPERLLKEPYYGPDRSQEFRGLLNPENGPFRRLARKEPPEWNERRDEVGGVFWSPMEKIFCHKKNLEFGAKIIFQTKSSLEKHA